jgi:hypothetical protein
VRFKNPPFGSLRVKSVQAQLPHRRSSFTPSANSREREKEKVCRSGEIFHAHAGRLQFTWSLRAAARTHSRAHYIMCSCVRALRNEFAHSSGARQAIQAADANMRHYLSRCCQHWRQTDRGCEMLTTTELPLSLLQPRTLHWWKKNAKTTKQELDFLS